MKHIYKRGAYFHGIGKEAEYDLVILSSFMGLNAIWYKCCMVDNNSFEKHTVNATSYWVDNWFRLHNETYI